MIRQLGAILDGMSLAHAVQAKSSNTATAVWLRFNETNDAKRPDFRGVFRFLFLFYRGFLKRCLSSTPFRRQDGEGRQLY